jgi:hypothetical protein
MISTYVLAQMTGRYFLINWTGPYRLDRHIVPHVHDWTIGNLDKVLSKERRFIHYDSIDDASILDTCLEEVAKVENRLIYVSANLLHRGMVGRGREDGFVEEEFHRAFRDLFQLREYGPTGFFRDFDGLLGVQLRTGEGNGWSDPKMGRAEDAGRLIEAAISSAREMGVQHRGLFFTSDSLDAKDLARLQGALVLDGPIAHLDRSTDVSLEAFDFTFNEFLALSNCAAVFNNSGAFGITAAMTGGRPFRRIIL